MRLSVESFVSRTDTIRTAHTREHASVSTMSKHVFLRRNGVLIDPHAEHGGERCTAQIPASMLGETPSAEERTRQLSEVRDVLSEDSPGMEALALREDDSPEKLDALLRALDRGSMQVPMDLVPFADDARVRPALIRAARRAPANRLANFVQVVGIVGGRGAVKVLRKRLAELARDPATMEDHSFFNDLAGSLASTAEALLALDPEALDATDALVMLFEHPCAFNRRTALREAAEALRRLRKTEAAVRLRSALKPLLDRAGPEEFAVFARDLAAILPERVLARAEDLLRSDDPRVREDVFTTLSQIPLPRALALALDGLPRVSTLDRAMTIAHALSGLVPLNLGREIARRALSHDSPTLRWHAVKYLLPSLPRETSSELAAEALKDEPDEALQRLLGKFAGA